MIQFAVGETIPHLTLPLEVSEARRAARGAAGRDRFEEADREFFQRVERGYDAIAASEPSLFRVIDAARNIDQVAENVWLATQPLLRSRRPGVKGS